jgi:hypothetical protein
MNDYQINVFLFLRLCAYRKFGMYHLREFNFTKNIENRQLFSKYILISYIYIFITKFC